MEQKENQEKEAFADNDAEIAKKTDQSAEPDQEKKISPHSTSGRAKNQLLRGLVIVSLSVVGFVILLIVAGIGYASYSCSQRVDKLEAEARSKAQYLNSLEIPNLKQQTTNEWVNGDCLTGNAGFASITYAVDLPGRQLESLVDRTLEENGFSSNGSVKSVDGRVSTQLKGVIYRYDSISSDPIYVSYLIANPPFICPENMVCGDPNDYGELEPDRIYHLDKLLDMEISTLVIRQ